MDCIWIIKTQYFWDFHYPQVLHGFNTILVKIPDILLKILTPLILKFELKCKKKKKAGGFTLTDFKVI